MRDGETLTQCTYLVTGIEKKVVKIGQVLQNIYERRKMLRTSATRFREIRDPINSLKFNIQEAEQLLISKEA